MGVADCSRRGGGGAGRGEAVALAREGRVLGEQLLLLARVLSLRLLVLARHLLHVAHLASTTLRAALRTT